MIYHLRKRKKTFLKVCRQSNTINSARLAVLRKMNHDLRTPLNVILGYAQLLQRDKSLSSAQLEYLTILNQNSENLLSLLHNYMSVQIPHLLKAKNIQDIKHLLFLPKPISANETQAALELIDESAREAEALDYSNQGHETILIVDDDIDNRRFLVNMLPSHNYRIRSAKSATEAFAILENITPNLIVLDVLLPDLNGYELCRRLKQNPKTAQIPVIFLSAHHEVEEKIQGFKAGGVDYISKPFNIEECLTRIETHLKISELRIGLEQKGAALDLANQQLKTEIVAHRESERRFKTMFSGAPLGMALSDAETGLMLEVNPMFAKITQRTLEQVKLMDWMSITHPDDLQIDLDKIEMLNSGVIEKYQQDKRFVSPEGEFIWVNMTISLINAVNQVGMQHLCVIKDITERKKADAQKLELQAQFLNSSKLASIGMLAAGVAHEINNPLAIIKAHAEFLEKTLIPENGLNEEARETAKHSCEKQQNAIQRVIKIVNNLRTYADTDSKFEGQINLQALALDTIALVEQIYKKTGITIVMDFAAPNHEVKGGIGKLQNVLMTLLSNAKDALEGSTKKVITVKTEINSERKIILSVTDTGIGIDEKNIDKLFMPFFTTKPPRHGMGLSLSLALSMMTEMHGTIKVDSVGGSGATFKIILPLADPHE